MEKFSKQPEQSSYSVRRQATRDAKSYADAAIQTAIAEIQQIQGLASTSGATDTQPLDPFNPDNPLTPIQPISISIKFKNTDDSYDYDESKSYGSIIISSMDGSNMTLVTAKAESDFDLNNLQIQVAPID